MAQSHMQNSTVLEKYTYNKVILSLYWSRVPKDGWNVSFSGTTVYTGGLTLQEEW